MTSCTLGSYTTSHLQCSFPNARLINSARLDFSDKFGRVARTVCSCIYNTGRLGKLSAPALGREDPRRSTDNLDKGGVLFAQITAGMLLPFDFKLVY